MFVLKEGKESGQGVAYLDDGTMIVVENGRRFIGKNVEVAVTSVLQTTAGKMIFGRHIEAGAPAAAPVVAPVPQPPVPSTHDKDENGRRPRPA